MSPFPHPAPIKDNLHDVANHSLHHGLLSEKMNKIFIGMYNIIYININIVYRIYNII